MAEVVQVLAYRAVRSSFGRRGRGRCLVFHVHVGQGSLPDHQRVRLRLETRAGLDACVLFQSSEFGKVENQIQQLGSRERCGQALRHGTARHSLLFNVLRLDRDEFAALLVRMPA